MNICGAGSVGNSLTTRLQHQWQVEDMQHCCPSLDLPAPATWDLDVSMPPEELRFAAGWQQRREGYQSSGADQGTQKPSRRAAAARAQCGPCDSPKMQRDGFWRPTHPCERLFTQSPPIMRPPSESAGTNPGDFCVAAVEPRIHQKQRSLKGPGPVRSRQRVGEVLEGRGLWQLLQDAVLLEVFLRRAHQLPHDAGDDQHVWRPGICNRTAWVSTTVTEQGIPQ